MEPPISLDPEAIRDEKAKVLRCLKPIDPKSIDQSAVRGQYGPGYILGQSVPGYRQEEGVANDSRQQTYTALKLQIDNWRWASVPFYIRSGKRLAKSITEIAVHFKQPPYALFAGLADPSLAMPSQHTSPNVLVMQIQPDEGISLKFATKQPGQTTHLRWLNMDFKYGTAFGVRTPTAYERLILDCLLGDPSLFSRSDQVEVCWRFVEPLLDAWGDRDSKVNFPNYAAGSWGPEAADQLLQSTGHSWRRL
jgi:glucose-6-phosphate 1-dehydrogenase